MSDKKPVHASKPTSPSGNCRILPVAAGISAQFGAFDEHSAEEMPLEGALGA
jgi:hypothetical protein